MSTTGASLRPRFASSFGWMLGGDLVNKGLRFVATIFLARVLSLEEFGVVNLAIAAVGVVVVVTSLGLPDLTAQRVALDAAYTRPLASTVIGLRLAGTAVVILIGAAAALVIDPSSVPIVAYAAAMALAMSASTDWALRGTEQTRALGAIWAVGGVTLLMGVVMTSFLHPSPILALGAFAFSEMVLAVCMVYVLGGVTTHLLHRSEAARMIREAWPLGVSAVVVYTYYANIDTLILGITRSTREAGLYSGPYRIFLVLNIVGVFAAYALSPRLARRNHLGNPSFDEASVVLKLLAAFGLLVTAAAIVGGEELLRLTLGGPFATAAPTFALLSTAVAWYSVGYPVGYSLVAQGRNRAFMAGAATAGAVNLLLDLALIPSYGAIAAGGATAVSFATAALVWLRLSSLDQRLAWQLVGVLSVGSTLCIGTLLVDEATLGCVPLLILLAGGVAAGAVRDHRDRGARLASTEAGGQ